MSRVSERMMQLELLRIEVNGSEFVGMVQGGDGVGKVKTGSTGNGGRRRFGDGRVARCLSVGVSVGVGVGGFGLGVNRGVPRFTPLASSVNGTERFRETGTGGSGGCVLFRFGQRESRPDPASCGWPRSGDVRESRRGVL